MSTFADVAAFAAQHAACGGLVPRAHSKRDDGYMLTITCTCGAVHERWVTGQEAQHLPRLPAAPAAAPRRPPPTPSPELLAALDKALAEPPPPATPSPPPTAVDQGPASVPPPVLAASSPRAPNRTQPPSPTPSVAMEAAIRAALGAQKAADAAEGDAPRRRAVIVAAVAVACLVLTGAGMFWVTQLESGRLATSPATPPVRSDSAGLPAPSVPAPAPAPAAFALSDEDRRALDVALESLRQLQSVSNTGNTVQFYRSRVEMMQERVRPFLASRAPSELREAVRDVADVHALASEIWRARLDDQPDAWARVGRSDILRSCPQIARVLEFSEQAPGVGEGRARVLGSAMPLLWTCSADRLARIDRLLAGR
jgi:hypothetical protein